MTLARDAVAGSSSIFAASLRIIASSVTAAKASLFLSSSGRCDPIFVKASRISVAESSRAGKADHHGSVP